MPWQALVVVLLAALAHWCTFRRRLPVCALRAAGRAHADWNIGPKKVGGGTHFVLMGALFVGVLWAPLGIWLAVHEVPQWGAAQWAAVLASALLHLVYVAPAREVSMLFAALLGGQLPGEADRGARLLGALAMVAGGAMLVLG
jgi:hypothetical protein